jgi:hypothetical protein
MTEEPYALVRASTGLWEPWAGNRPGPPGPTHLKTAYSGGKLTVFEAWSMDKSCNVRGVGEACGETLLTGQNSVS